MSIRRPYKWLGAQRYGYENNRANQLLTFKAFASPSGVANLSSDLTINGSTVTASYVYYGGDASASGWSARVGGEDLSLVSVATPPTYNDGSPLLGADDDSVKFNGSDYFIAGNQTFGNITTEDFVIEGIIKIDPASAPRFLNKYGANQGYFAGCSSSAIRVQFGDSVTAKAITSLVLSDYCWHHFLCFVNKDEASVNGSQLYVNGIASGVGVDVSSVGSISRNVALQLGSSFNTYDENLAYCAMWKKASWHQAGAAGPTEWATIAATRFAQLTGTYPQVAAGTALPTTATRTYPAYLDKVESDGTSKLYQVGAEWMRQCSRKDANGVELKGYLPEPAATNNFTYSEQFNDAAWTKVRLTSVSANAIAAPNGELTADGVIANTTDSTHTISQSVTHIASNNVASVWAKSGDKTWLRISTTAATPGAASCYFDLNNCAVGTGTNATGYIEDWGNGWCRCIISYTGDGTGALLVFSSGEADGDITFAGDDVTVNTYLWGAQHETTGLGYATSYIPTTTAAATRLKDELKYVAGANIGGEDVGQGTIACSVLFPSYDLVASSTYFFSLSDGGSAADRLYLYMAGATDQVIAGTQASGGNAGTAAVNPAIVSPTDNYIHNLIVNYETNRLILICDSANSNIDTSVDIPDDIDTMHVGMLTTDANHAGCLLSNIRIYKEPTTGGN